MPQPFRFRLETVLRVRDLREREARRRFGAKQAEIARLDRLNEQTAAQIVAQQSTLLGQQQQSRIDAAGLVRARSWIAHLRRTILERQVARQSLVTQLTALREAFRQARTARRVIEKLRERRSAEWKRMQALRE